MRAGEQRLRRRRRVGPRPATIAVKRLHASDRERVSLDILDAVERPVHRSDCEDGPRPCPWVACKHHLYLEVNGDNGSIKLNWPGRELDDMAETCALDVAERDGVVLDDVGALLNISRERARQLEHSALRAVRQKIEQVGT